MVFPKHPVFHFAPTYYIVSAVNVYGRQAPLGTRTSGALLLRWTTLIPDMDSPGQNGRHFADDIFKCVFMTEKFCISIRISRKFVSKGPIDKKSVLIYVMALRRTDDKPLPESILTQFTNAYM